MENPEVGSFSPSPGIRISNSNMTPNSSYRNSAADHADRNSSANVASGQVSIADFERFAKTYINAFHATVCSKNIDSPVDVNPVVGHPSFVIVLMCRLLLECLVVDDSTNATKKHTNAWDWIVAHSNVGSSEARSGNSISSVANTVAVTFCYDTTNGNSPIGTPSAPPKSPNERNALHVTPTPQQFCLMVHCLACAAHFPHNCAIISSSLGELFAVVMVGAMRACVNMLEEGVHTIVETQQLDLSIDKGEGASRLDVGNGNSSDSANCYDKTACHFSILLGLAQFCSRCSVESVRYAASKACLKSNLSDMVVMQGESSEESNPLLPPALPWSPIDCAGLGMNVGYDTTMTVERPRSPIESSSPSEVESISSSPVPVSRVENLSAEPSNSQSVGTQCQAASTCSSTNTVSSGFVPYLDSATRVHSLGSMHTGDKVSVPSLNVLLQEAFLSAGCVRVILSIMRKIMYFSIVMSESIERNGRKLKSGKNSGISANSVLLIDEMWTSSLVLQLEMLHGVLTYMYAGQGTSSPGNQGWEQYHMSEGPEVLRAVLGNSDIKHDLSMAIMVKHGNDVKNSDLVSRVQLKSLIFLRGYLCLRINELCVHASAASNDCDEGISDSYVVIKGLQRFIKWYVQDVCEKTPLYVPGENNGATEHNALPCLVCIAPDNLSNKIGDMSAQYNNYHMYCPSLEKVFVDSGEDKVLDGAALRDTLENGSCGIHSNSKTTGNASNVDNMFSTSMDPLLAKLFESHCDEKCIARIKNYWWMGGHPVHANVYAKMVAFQSLYLFDSLFQLCNSVIIQQERAQLAVETKRRRGSSGDLSSDKLSASYLKKTEQRQMFIFTKVVEGVLGGMETQYNPSCGSRATSQKSRESDGPLTFINPIIQAHTILFLRRCLMSHPGQFVLVSRSMQLAHVITSSNCFWKSGLENRKWCDPTDVDGANAARSSHSLELCKNSENTTKVILWTPLLPEVPLSSPTYVQTTPSEYIMNFVSLRDMILDYLQLAVGISLSARMGQNAALNSSSDNEIDAVLVLLAQSAKQDDVIVQSSRWLLMLARYIHDTACSGIHDKSSSSHHSAAIKEALKSRAWGNVLSKALSICRIISPPNIVHASMKYQSLKFDSNSGDVLLDIEDSRPFLWPARASIILLMQYLISLRDLPGWTQGFYVPAPVTPSALSLPTSTPSSSQKRGRVNSTASVMDDSADLSGHSRKTGANTAPSSTTRQPKHIVLFFLLHDARCRDAAVTIIADLFQKCVLEWVACSGKFNMIRTEGSTVHQYHSKSNLSPLSVGGGTTDNSLTNLISRMMNSAKKDSSVNLREQALTYQALAFDILKGLINQVTYPGSIVSDWSMGAYEVARYSLHAACECLYKIPTSATRSLVSVAGGAESSSLNVAQQLLNTLPANIVTSAGAAECIVSGAGPGSSSFGSNSAGGCLAPNLFQDLIKSLDAFMKYAFSNSKTNDLMGVNVISPKKSSRMLVSASMRSDILRLWLKLLFSLIVDNVTGRDAFTRTMSMRYRAAPLHNVADISPGSSVPGSPEKLRYSKSSDAPEVISPTNANSYVHCYQSLAYTIRAVEPSGSFLIVSMLFDILLDGRLINNCGDAAWFEKFQEVRASKAHVPLGVSNEGVTSLYYDASVIGEAEKYGLFENSDPSSTPSSTPYIMNVSILPVIISLIPYCSGPLQACVLKSLLTLVTGRARMINLSKCSHIYTSTTLLDLFIDIFPGMTSVPHRSLLIKLLQSVGQHSISVAQLKRIFMLMQSYTAGGAVTKSAGSAVAPSGEYRSPHVHPLLEALTGMIDTSGDAHVVCREGKPEGCRSNAVIAPKYFFLFEGNESGLRLPSFSYWPATRGYTFCTWFCLSSSSSGNGGGYIVGKMNGKNAVDIVPNYVDDESVRDSELDNSLSTGSRGSAATTNGGILYRPTVLSFKDLQGVGMEICFEQDDVNNTDYRFVMKSFVGKKEVPCVIVEIPTSELCITEGEWHFLAVSHVASGFRTKSEISVLVDNTYIAKTPLPFPRFSDICVGPTIGNCCPLDAETQFSHVDTSFHGQMSSIYMFSEALSAIQMRGIKELGPNYSQLFNNRDALSSQASGNGSSTESNLGASSAYMQNVALDGSLTNHIILAYNPAIWKKEYSIDNTPDRNNIKWKVVEAVVDNKARGSSTKSTTYGGIMGWFGVAGSSSSVENKKKFVGLDTDIMNAYRLSGTYMCSSKDMRVALNCLGGIKVLLPLFAQFDLPLLCDRSSTGLHVGTPDAKMPQHVVDYSINESLCVRVLELLFCLLQDTPLNNVLMKSTGFALFSYVLERISPKYLTTEALRTIIQLSDSLSWNEKWQNSVYEHILCNFRLWIYSPFAVQKILFEYLLEMCKANPVRFRQILPLQQLLDALFLKYSAVGEEYDLEQTLHIDALGGVMGSSSSAGGQSRKPSFASDASRSNSNIADSFGGSVSFGRSRAGHKRRGVAVTRDGAYSSILPEKIVHPVTHETVGVRLVGTELLEVRNILWQIVYHTITSVEADGSGKAADRAVTDIHSLLNYICLEKCENHKIQCLKILLRLMNSSNAIMCKHVIRAFSCPVSNGGELGSSGGECDSGSQDGVNILLSLIKFPKARCRLYGLIAFCSLLQVAACHGTLPPVSTAKAVDSDINIVDNVDFDLDDSRAESLYARNSSFAGRYTGFGSGARPSVVDPNVSNAKPTSTPGSLFRSAAVKSSFDEIGIPVNRIMPTVSWVVGVLVTLIGSDFIHQNTQQQQIRIAYVVLSLAMHGSSCIHLSHEVDNLLPISSSSASKTEAFRQTSRVLNSLRVSGDSLDTLNSQRFSTNTPTKVDNVQSSECDSPDCGFFESRETVSSAVICIPMIFPGILALLKHNLVSTRQRHELYVSLKVSVQTSSNSDVILLIPSWQYYVFDFIAEEQKRCFVIEDRIMSGGNSVVHQKLDNEELNTSKGIIEAGIRMLCDVQVHAIKLCCPIGNWCVGRPDESTYCDLSNLSPNDMAESLFRGRKVGASVLKDTISYLRCFASAGSLDMQSTGFRVLQKTIRALQHESESLDNAFSDSVEGKTLRRRLLNLNLWLTAAVLLEFIAVPAIQPSGTKPLNSACSNEDFVSMGKRNSRKMVQFQLKQHNTGPVKRAGMFRTALANRKSLRNADAATTDVMSPKEDNSISSTHVRMTSAPATLHSMPSEVVGDANRARGFSENSNDDFIVGRSIDLSMDEAETGASLANRFNVGGAAMYENKDTDMIAIDAELPIVEESGGDSSTDEASLRSSEPDGFEEITSDYSEVVWDLIDDVLTLLRLDNHDSRTNKFATLKYSLMQIGIRKGYMMRSAVNSTIDSIVTQPGAHIETNTSSHRRSIIGGPSPNMSPVKVASNPFERAIEGVLWMVMRVLTNMIVGGGAGVPDDSYLAIRGSSEKMSDVHFRAAQHMEAVINSPDGQSQEYMPFEVMHVIFKLSTALFNTHLTMSHEWTQNVFYLMIKLIHSQRVAIITRFHETAMKGSGESAGWAFSSSSVVSDFVDQLHPLNSASARKAVAADESTIAEKIEEKVGNLSRSQTNLAAGEKMGGRSRGNSTTSDDGEQIGTTPQQELLRAGVIEAIEYTLQFAYREDVEVARANSFSCPLSWEIWTAVMHGISVEAKTMEDKQLSSKLTDTGLHRHAHELQQTINSIINNQSRIFSMFEGAVFDVLNLTTGVNESKRIKEYEKNVDAPLRKEAERKWKNILQELTNERGPWGKGVTGISNTTEVFWMLDSIEDNFRRRPKMIRNDKGTKHRVASELSNPPEDASRSISVSDVAAAMVKQQLDLAEVQPPLEAADGVSTPMDDSPPSGIEIDTEVKLDPDGASMFTPGGVNLVEDETGTILQYSGLIKDLSSFQNNPNRNRTHTKNDDSSDEEYMEYDGEQDQEDGVQFEESAISVSMLTEAVQSGGNSRTLFRSEKVMFTCPCEVIVASTNSCNGPSVGTLEITKTSISFVKSTLRKEDIGSAPKWAENTNQEHLWACNPFPSTTWSTEDVYDVLRRHYQLRFVAIELFFTNRTSVFINLYEQSMSRRALQFVRFTAKPPHIRPFYGKNPMEIVTNMNLPNSASKLTGAWVSREISNFEYLMKLNHIAGRTFNDMGQYPVFPWIIADYVSSQLDLKSSKTFRDLRWPMGAQNVEQRKVLLSKYHDLESMYEPPSEANEVAMGLPPFHFGSHYSVNGFVLWYLMRMEPYTSLHVALQDGKFDKADRLFDSFEAAWNSCTNNPSDVKELIPELFYCPEILENVNEIDLGRTQSGKKLGNVQLPPWAKDPYDFIYQHRKALESEYVSLNLHHWIDLIFGYKQRPPHVENGSAAAVEACNVFFHLTYSGAVELDELRTENPLLYDQCVTQIAEFGQTPCQLFTQPHPHRQPLGEIAVVWPIASVLLGVDTMPRGSRPALMPAELVCYNAVKVSFAPILLIAEANNRLVTVDLLRIVGSHQWTPLSPDVVPPFKFKADYVALDLSKWSVHIAFV